jgi:ribokinase
VVGLRTQTGPGGKGANQAAAAGALSPGVAMVGRVGDDSAGHALIADLAARGVDTATVLPTPDVPTGTATVAVEDGGENLIVVAPGANHALTPSDVDVPAVCSAAVVLLQLEIPFDTVAAAATAASGTVVLNPAPAAPLPDELFERADVLVPNEWELCTLAGAEPGTHCPERLAELARKITSRDVVVTLGARGALLVPAAGPPTVVAAPAVTPVDTTGAGDCFCGALAVALSRGEPLADAARYAVVAAALSTTGPGARGALPDDPAVRAAL